ncbi:protein toll [Caerostris darwini]|uniref:Protein toll n=1 Tax=Caerostris darwini TaxID=1538125 RepID=A0AAV4PEA7_9ARAC|nr:protein toll [Caerostris darwini]
MLILLVILSLDSAACELNETDSVVDFFPAQICEDVLPECQCDYKLTAELTCRKVSDFETFTQRLADGTLYEVNTAYDIELSGNSVLPRGFLQSLNVFRLVVDDPHLQGFEEGAFQGVIQLKHFDVRSSSITRVPDFRLIRDSVRTIHIDNSQLASLDGRNLQYLSMLEILSFFNNSIEYVAPDAFQGIDGVTYFNISHNRLTSLPPDLFKPWSKLKYVILSHNQLLHVDQLFLTTHPKEIHLNHNNLTDLDSVLHPRMYNVDQLQLSHNPFPRVTQNSFNGKVNNTGYLYLDHCLIREFDVRHYLGMPILVKLDLSYNLIEQVANRRVQFGSYQNTSFVVHMVKKYNSSLPYMMYHRQSQNSLKVGQIAHLSLAGNQIQNLSSEDFRELDEVRYLHLQNNFISTVERFTFTVIRYDLMFLDLSRNKIRSLQGCIRFLSVLNYLNLTDNWIESFEEGEFEGLNELTDLYLQGNRITTLGNKVQRLLQLQYLDISSNRIRTLRKEQIPEKLKYLYLAGNPFSCDCKLLPFLSYLNSTNNLNSEVPLCTPPNDTSPIPPPSNCPPGCRCFCTHDAQRHFMSVDCSSLGLTRLPALFSAATGKNSNTAIISYPVEYRIRYDGSSKTRWINFAIQDEIAGLDITNNSLQSMEEARFPEGMVHLLLANNQLRVPPTALLYSLEKLSSVTLSGNPWTCDCNVISFKKWILSKSDIVPDANITRCGPEEAENRDLIQKAIWSLTDLDLCSENIGLYVTLAFVVPFFLLSLAGGKIAWTRYQMHVKVWLYSHGVTWVKEKDIDKDKEFDAFISFSHKDQDLVIPELIDLIEVKYPKVKLFIHYKHFLPGELIQLNIIRAIHISKRTVLVLSKSFLESEWCMFEFKFAHIEALKDHLNRIIVIKMDDLPKDEELPEDIQVYLKSTTYLTWGDKYFWDTLLYALPIS